jgi:ABC-type sugar transport system ATPase subunit
MASFLGDANLLPGTVAHGTVTTSLGRLVLRDGLVESWPSDRPEVTVLIRPEQIEVRARSAAPASGGVPALVHDRSYFGHDAILHVQLERHFGEGTQDQTLLIRVTGVAPPQPGSEVLLTVRGPVMAWPVDGTARLSSAAPGV